LLLRPPNPNFLDAWFDNFCPDGWPIANTAMATSTNIEKIIAPGEADPLEREDFCYKRKEKCRRVS